jgi:hypothetical protein
VSRDLKAIVREPNEADDWLSSYRIIATATLCAKLRIKSLDFGVPMCLDPSLMRLACQATII